MHERIVSAGVVASRMSAERVIKMFLDSGSFEIIPVEKVFGKGILSTDRDNPYEEPLSILEELYRSVGKEPKPDVYSVRLPVVLDEVEMEEFVSGIKERFKEIEREKERLEKELDDLRVYLNALELIEDLDVDIGDVLGMRYLKLRIGWFQKMNYERFMRSVSDMDVAVLKVAEVGDGIHVLIFHSRSDERTVEKVLSSASFVPLYLPKDKTGTPKELFLELKDKRRALEIKLEELELRKREIFYENRHRIYEYYDEVFVLKRVHDMFRNSGFTEEFVVIVGWMVEKNLKELRGLESEDVLVFENVEIPLEKPTLLKNPGFFKHFEFLVKMYGIPRSDEIDPTPFVAILFLFFYGFMFGDVGHGGVISALAWWLFRKTAADIWYVMSLAGISSVFFGFVYGSVFGFEIIPPLFKRPMENVEDFLIISVVIGVVMIVFGMVLNVINRISRSEYRRLVFDPNGVAGLGFYLTAVSNVYSYLVLGETLFPTPIVLGLIGTFLLTMFLNSIVFEEGGLGERFILAFFDTLDRIIGFFSNTLSFIRLGAFAMNHAGLFLAFYTMAKMSSNPVGSFFSILMGNLLLIFLEGLIVFIQSVRLEFYEFFSKFYSGDGREFSPITYRNEGGVGR